MNRDEIAVIYGTDIPSMTRTLLDRVDWEKLPKTASIGLKPNLVVANLPSSGATTHPEIAETIIQYLQEKGYRNLCIIESAWVGDSTQRGFAVCGYDKMSKKYNVPLYDVKRDSYIARTVDGVRIEMSERVMGLDYLINLPVLKGHCQTAVTCALKNMKGCISDRSKRLFHSLGLHRPIALLNSIRSADLVIVDSICGDLDFEEGGNPVRTNRMMIGTDSVLIDSYGASLMGYTPEEIDYIPIAASLGVGSMDLSKAKIVELNQDRTGAKSVSTRKIKSLEKYVSASSACSACYGNLIHALARLQDRGELGRLPAKIYIGQDYKGQSKDGIGIGQCTSGFPCSIKGCPPRAVDIVRFLEQEMGL